MTNFFKKIFINRRNMLIICFIMQVIIVFPFFRDYGSYISLMCCMIVSPFLVYEIFFKKNLINTKGYVFLLLFLLSYFITFVLSAKKDVVSTLHGFLWLIIDFFVIYSYDKNEDINVVKKELLSISNIIVYFCTTILLENFK